MARPEKHVFVCTQFRPEGHPKGCCTERGGKEVMDAFAKEFEARELWGKFKLNSASCLGICEVGPAVLVYPEAVMYKEVKSDDVNRIIESHLLEDTPVEDLMAPSDIW